MNAVSQTIVKANGLICLDSKLRCNAFDAVLETCNYVASTLSAAKYALTENVVARCLTIAATLNLTSPVRLQLELAARVHRVGELSLHENLRDKCFLDMSLNEMRAYKQYPVFSAERLGEKSVNPLHNILLFHREYFASSGFLNQLNGVAIPVASRVLCLATEYEEFIMYRGTGLAEQEGIQNFVTKNQAGRYDPQVVEALISSLTQEAARH